MPFHAESISILKSYRYLLVIIIIFISFNSVKAQNDTIVLQNGNTLVGELKEMQKGVLILKTGYSDSDFKVKWKKVKTVHTETKHLLSVKPGKRYNGSIKPADSLQAYIVDRKDTLHKTRLKDILYVREIKTGSLSKFSGELSVGYNFTKAQRTTELSIRTRLSYQSDRWTISGKYDDIRSTRKNSSAVERTEGSINFNYILKNNWFTITEVSAFSNTEQNISLRILALQGIGKMIFQTEKLYWSGQAGITYNDEDFKSTSDVEFKRSAEAFVGTELNLFDIKDFSLLTRAMVYPGISESGRWRIDYNIDLKYDLPLDFFLKLGYSLNYDNKPVANAASTDYIFQTTIGWDFN